MESLFERISRETRLLRENNELRRRVMELENQKLALCLEIGELARKLTDR